MIRRKDDRDGSRALAPFVVGDTEVLLVPNQLNGSEPTVLLIARHQGTTISSQLTLTEARRLATYLDAAADEAEALASSHFAQGRTSTSFLQTRSHTYHAAPARSILDTLPLRR